ncbi:MAG: hypothetical protein WC690_08845, partial [bacterium]
KACALGRGVCKSYPSVLFSAILETIPDFKVQVDEFERTRDAFKTTQSRDECTVAADDLVRLAENTSSMCTKETILNSALKALAGRSKLGRMEAPRVLKALAMSDLPPASKERMIDPLFQSLARDVGDHDGELSRISFAFTALAASDIAVDRKIAMLTQAMRATGIGNDSRKKTAYLTVNYIAGRVKPAELGRVVDCLLAASQGRDARLRAGALIGMGGVLESKAPQDVKLRLLATAITMAGDLSVEVKNEAVATLGISLVTDLPATEQAKALGILLQSAKSSNQAVKKGAVGTIAWVAGMESLHLEPARSTLRPEFVPPVIPILTEAMRGRDVVIANDAINGLTSFVQGSLLKPSDAFVKDAIPLLRSDSELVRKPAEYLFEQMAMNAEEPLLSTIKQTLEKKLCVAAPDVQRVTKTGEKGEVERSWKYIATLTFSELPPGAVSVRPVANGYDQSLGWISNKKASCAVWMDRRDSFVHAVVKFYNRTGAMIAESDGFIIDNPDATK